MSKDEIPQWVIDDDFKTMKSMIDTIQERIKDVDTIKQHQFCKFLKGVIFEAFLDATNEEDSFLYSEAFINRPNFQNRNNE